ncbi:MAG: phosphomannose isomerase type II C-terminal cupin domain [Flavobacteriaceae bacterium]|nr:phosphomannose isomerase type II C-terminal cupin domain [Flavobacteriaceae bacterium]
MYMEKRPWGAFFVLSDEKDFKIKKIEVNPSKRLSYQFHNKRSELWYILKGVGIVTINDKKTEVKKGSIVKIKKLEKHRIENNGTKTLTFIEVQTGSYFGEDDIVRIQDDFDRD